MDSFWRPSKEQVAAAQGGTVPDLIGPGLKVLFCGINPSLYSAAVGHHFARPGNRFWPAIYGAGFTDRRLDAFHERELLARGCGITNVVARATASADELSAGELVEGARDLGRKVRRACPTYLAVLGVGAYRTAFDRPRAVLGPQAERIGPTRIWVMPNPSGLNAHYRLDDLVRLFADLRRAADGPAD